MTCEEVQVYLEGDFGDRQPISKQLANLGRLPAGGVSPRKQDPAVAEHLRMCPACAEYSRRLAVENRVLKDILAKPPAEERWQRVKARLAERMALELAWRNRRRRTVWALAAAAAVLLCLGGSLLLRFMARTTVPGCSERVGQSPNSQETLASGLARLQEDVRTKQLLDELEQLQIAFRDAGDADGRSVAEDAELYVERILALDGAHPDQASEILAGIKAAGIHERVQKVRQSIADDAPAPVRASLDLAATTLDRAVFLASEK